MLEGTALGCQGWVWRFGSLTCDGYQRISPEQGWISRCGSSSGQELLQELRQRELEVDPIQDPSMMEGCAWRDEAPWSFPDVLTRCHRRGNSTSGGWMGLLQPGINSLQSWGVHTELGAPELWIGKRFLLLEILEHSLPLSQHRFGVNVCCWLIQFPHPLAGWQRAAP